MPSEPIRVIVVIVVHPREVLPFSLGQDFAHPTLASLVDRNQTLDDHHVTPNAVELRMDTPRMGWGACAGESQGSAVPYAQPAGNAATWQTPCRVPACEGEVPLHTVPARVCHATLAGLDSLRWPAA